MIDNHLHGRCRAGHGDVHLVVHRVGFSVLVGWGFELQRMSVRSLKTKHDTPAPGALTLTVRAAIYRIRCSWKCCRTASNTYPRYLPLKM